MKTKKLNQTWLISGLILVILIIAVALVSLSYQNNAGVHGAGNGEPKTIMGGADGGETSDKGF
jgi:hypothetical protein